MLVIAHDRSVHTSVVSLVAYNEAQTVNSSSDTWCQTSTDGESSHELPVVGGIRIAKSRHFEKKRQNTAR